MEGLDLAYDNVGKDHTFHCEAPAIMDYTTVELGLPLFLAIDRCSLSHL